MITCDWCHKPMANKTKSKICNCCSFDCYQTWYRKHKKGYVIKGEMSTNPCRRCGSLFVAFRKDQVECRRSKKPEGGKSRCKLAEEKRMRKCGFCGDVFRAMANGQRFCSTVCQLSQPHQKMGGKVSTCVRQSLAASGSRKQRKSVWNHLPYSKRDLRAHLESFFSKENGFSWENLGTVWHMDHIVPKSWFHYSSMDDSAFKECWALSNLRPEFANVNLSKGNRFASKPIQFVQPDLSL